MIQELHLRRLFHRDFHLVSIKCSPWTRQIFHWSRDSSHGKPSYRGPKVLCWILLLQSVSRFEMFTTRNPVSCDGDNVLTRNTGSVHCWKKNKLQSSYWKWRWHVLKCIPLGNVQKDMDDGLMVHQTGHIAAKILGMISMGLKVASSYIFNFFLTKSRLIRIHDHWDI